MSAPDHASADEVLTIDQAAMLLDIQPTSVQAAIRRGALPTVGTAAAWRDTRPHLRRTEVEAYGANRRTWKSKVPWPPGRPVR